MDTATAIGSVFAAFGLSGAAGLNAWLPLFVSALLARGGVVDLAEPFGELEGTTALVVLGLLTAGDFVGDKIPAVDHVLHAAGTVVAPASGAILFTGQTGAETDLPTLAAALIGAIVAGSVHLERAAVSGGIDGRHGRHREPARVLRGGRHVAGARRRRVPAAVPRVPLRRRPARDRLPGHATGAPLARPSPRGRRDGHHVMQVVSV